jgi:hypothetical protein
MRGASRIGRISMRPPAAEGVFAASVTASSRSRFPKVEAGQRLPDRGEGAAGRASRP